MKLSELKAIIVECLNESGPARLKRRASGEHIQDVGGRGDNQNPIRYDSEGNQLPKRARIMGTPNSTHVKYRGSGKNRQSDSTTGVRKYKGSFKDMTNKEKKLKNEGRARNHRRANGYQLQDTTGDPATLGVQDRQQFGVGFKDSKKIETYKRSAGPNGQQFKGKNTVRRKQGSFKKLGESEWGVKDSNGKKPKKMSLPPHLKGEWGTKYYQPSDDDDFSRHIRDYNKPKKIKEEKKYNATPPLKGFNRTEPMAYKKNSLSGKIAGLNKKINGKADK